MTEKDPNTELSRVKQVAEVMASGGYSLLDRKDAQAEEAPQAIPELLTEETLREKTGFKVVVEFPSWQTDAAGIIGFHDELERLGRDLGWENVIGSVYQDNESSDLKLGVFVKESAFPSESSS
ncbi:MAG TPA: hypothetical protein VMR34_04055 [Candidatus Saccharimonadales bacterium]|nr:hypothetical protein [Candidatus Saccharimonadales bacterium]